jgi:hypothetical protein
MDYGNNKHCGFIAMSEVLSPTGVANWIGKGIEVQIQVKLGIRAHSARTCIEWPNPERIVGWL